MARILYSIVGVKCTGQVGRGAGGNQRGSGNSISHGASHPDPEPRIKSDTTRDARFPLSCSKGFKGEVLRKGVALGGEREERS